jgi:hypothetical protein
MNSWGKAANKTAMLVSITFFLRKEYFHLEEIRDKIGLFGLYKASLVC